MKNSIRNISFLWFLIIHVTIFGQKETPQLLEPKLIKADIDTLITKLMDVHPTFLNHYNANNLKSKIDSIKNNITNPMSSLDFFRIMQPIVTIDGHTTLRHTGGLCPNEDSPLFPFKVLLFKNSLYIKENLSKNEALSKGTIIEKINGVSSEIFIRNLLRYIPGEKETYKLKKLEKDFHIYLALVYGSFSDFEITVNNSELKLKGARWDAFNGASKPKFELKFYDDDIAYIYKRKFMPPRGFLHFMDSAFTTISENQIKYLIIDNLQGGGLTDLADSLMSNFTDKPYSLIEKKMTKVSSLTKEFIESKKSRGHIKDGYFIEEYPKHSSVQNNQFSGKTYILNGHLSYSTGTSFPAAAKYNKTAFIVGEESGQPLVSHGDQNQFMLPGTKMFCITALSKVYMPGHNNDEVSGVIPDFNVTPTLDDLLDDKEYTLEYALKLIREDKFKKVDYLGETQPGDSAVVFAHGIISTDSTIEHGSPTFSPDGNQVFWQSNLRHKERKTEIFLKTMRRLEDKWTAPEPSPYGGMPAFSPDGKKFYFISDETEKEKGLYVIEKQGENWSEPKSLNLIARFPELKYLYGPSITSNGTLYFFGHADGLETMNNFGIYRSEFLNGEYVKPELLPASINATDGALNWTPYIAHDESYILFSSNRFNNQQDIFISLRRLDGTWTKAYNLGESINTNRGERFPLISPDGKFLFFTRWVARGNEDVMWISAKIINEIKEKVFEPEKREK